MLCFFPLVNGVLLNLLCVWVLFWNAGSHSLFKFFLSFDNNLFYLIEGKEEKQEKQEEEKQPCFWWNGLNGVEMLSDTQLE